MKLVPGIDFITGVTSFIGSHSYLIVGDKK